MRGHTGDELLRLPVRLRGIHLGRTVDVLLHPTEPQRDVVLGPEWAVEELVLEGAGGSRRVPLDGLALPARSRSRTG